ncbi:MAG: hypothetical protein HGA45_31220 [Chloroflexales bacterium]|nr:hypothetical protein [Chloroflexales bacterium]
MNQRFYQPRPDRLDVSEGGGCLALIGLPIFLQGLLTTFMAIGSVLRANGGEVNPWGLVMGGPVGLAFLAVGSLLIFGRRWTVLEQGRPFIARQWGLLVPMRQEELSLANFAAVALRFHKSDHNNVQYYLIGLKARGGGQDLALYKDADYGAGRARAAQVATLLGLPLEDATTSIAVVLAPGQVEAPLQERLRERGIESGEGERYEPATVPPQMRSQVEDLGGQVHISIPGPNKTIALIAQLVIPIGFAIYFGPSPLALFRRPDMLADIPADLRIMYSAYVVFLLIFFILAPILNFIIAGIGALRRRTRVSVTPGELVIEERETWRTRTTRIAAGEIVGLDRMPAKGVSVKYRRGMATFGAGLPDAELDYLRALVRRTLAG